MEPEDGTELPQIRDKMLRYEELLLMGEQRNGFLEMESIPDEDGGRNY